MNYNVRSMINLRWWMIYYRWSTNNYVLFLLFTCSKLCCIVKDIVWRIVQIGQITCFNFVSFSVNFWYQWPYCFCFANGSFFEIIITATVYFDSFTGTPARIPILKYATSRTKCITSTDDIVSTNDITSTDDTTLAHSSSSSLIHAGLV